MQKIRQRQAKSFSLRLIWSLWLWLCHGRGCQLALSVLEPADPGSLTRTHTTCRVQWTKKVCHVNKKSSEKNTKLVQAAWKAMVPQMSTLQTHGERYASQNAQHTEHWDHIRFHTCKPKLGIWSYSGYRLIEITDDDWKICVGLKIIPKKW